LISASEVKRTGRGKNGYVKLLYDYGVERCSIGTHPQEVRVSKEKKDRRESKGAWGGPLDL